MVPCSPHQNLTLTPFTLWLHILIRYIQQFTDVTRYFCSVFNSKYSHLPDCFNCSYKARNTHLFIAWRFQGMCFIFCTLERNSLLKIKRGFRMQCSSLINSTHYNVPPVLLPEERTTTNFLTRRRGVREKCVFALLQRSCYLPAAHWSFTEIIMRLFSLLLTRTVHLHVSH